MGVAKILELSIIIIVCLIFLLVILYAFILFKSKNNETTKKGVGAVIGKNNKGTTNKATAGYSKQSIYSWYNTN